ncbi:MAG: hypothetical protein ACK5KU_11370 [Beutenbergiaceae bacterium]
MTASIPSAHWRGTSDSPATLATRASLSIAERLAWLDEALDLAYSTGSLTMERAARQQAADRSGITSPVQH